MLAIYLTYSQICFDNVDKLLQQCHSFFSFIEPLLLILGSSKTSGRVALGRIWTQRKRKNYNSQRPTRVTQHQTRGRQRLGLETDADRRVFLHIHVDFGRSREEVTDRKPRDHDHEPGSGAHRQKTGQNGAQEEHGEGQMTGSNKGTFWMND